MSATNIINDLIEINNDRVAGFEKVITDIKDENVDLKALFQKNVEQSRKYGQELAAVVGDPDTVETGTSVAGTLHRAWIDVRALFTGGDRADILSEAERGEDAIKKAYSDAISGGTLTGKALDLVREQSTGINASHDAIKVLRDAAKA